MDIPEDENRRILIVDDDEIILVALKETLRPEGFEITTAGNAQEGLERASEQTFAVIISDQRMPEMTGLEFFKRAKKLQPSASRILITGVLSLTTIINAVNQGEIFRFLAKPWMREELLATVQNAHQRYALLAANNELQAETLKLNEELASANHKLAERFDNLKEDHASLDEAHFALRRNFDESLQLCHRLMEAYHPLLGQETRDVAELCDRIINLGQLEPKLAHTLKVSAWLHHIGLIGVPRELIHKARKDPLGLTSVERARFESAPEKAQELAKFVDQLAEVGATLRAQNERWDGRGYPDGLAGEMIPPAARLLAVVKAYVESGRTQAETLEMLMAESGKAFEPEAFRLLMKAVRPGKIPVQVKEILFGELAPGMVLARDLFSASGLLLLPEGKRLDEDTLRKIHSYNFVNPITQRILVRA